MRIGIHVRGFASGRPVAAARALERGAETLQIFASNPRQWRVPPVDPAADAEFRAALDAAGLGPLFLHAPYLVNLASPNPQTRTASCRTVTWTLARAASLGAAGVVVHAGHCAGRPRPEALREAGELIGRLAGAAPPGPRLLIELTSGARGAVASRLDEAAELLDLCGGGSRIGLCLDTCHLHAAGYDLTGPEGVAALGAETRREVGLERLGLIHANDSRDPRNSRRDRHEHIAAGAIGEAGFRALVADSPLGAVPLICETPGGLAEDRANVARLKGYRHAGRPGPALSPEPADSTIE